MKKKFQHPAIAMLMAFVSALLFLNCGQKEGANADSTKTSEQKWTLKKVDDFKIMTVAPDGDWLTDIKKAVLTKRMEDGNLPVSFAMTVEGAYKSDSVVGMDCRLQYDNLKAEAAINELKTVVDDSTFTSNGIFSFNFSKAENASIENLYHLSALSSGHLKMWVKPRYQNGQVAEWHELECNY
ncbi:MAG: hypothetical protein MJZ33_07195 [Paludibacteraceae bacterium]|nr:hypothetical protein [Paludibacteraceae bacterium]